MITPERIIEESAKLKRENNRLKEKIEKLKTEVESLNAIIMATSDHPLTEDAELEPYNDEEWIDIRDI